MALIPPDYMNAVVAIGDRASNGQVTWVASGFFFGRFRRRIDAENAEYATYLVTNRHVIDGLNDPVVRANPVSALPAQEIPLNLIDGSGNPVWVGHPDPDVDVAVTGVGIEVLRGLGLQVSFFADYAKADLATMRASGMSEGDHIFLLGFPMGLVGGPRSAVVVRGGTLAQFQSAADGASKSFIVDGYVFPGNSGGPVVSKPEAMAINGTTAVTASLLIGIVASYIPYLDVAISAQTGRNRVVFEENSGLSNIFPVDCIEQTVDAWERAYPREEQIVRSDIVAPADAADSD